MNLSIMSNAVELRHGVPTTTSLKVAEVFGKQHKNVIQNIVKLEISPELSKLNFQLTSTKVRQPNGGYRTIPMYNITRDGFTLLAMDFTGKVAMQFKIAYIQAFNAMEAKLREHEISEQNRLGIRIEELEAKIADLEFDRFLEYCAEAGAGIPDEQEVDEYLHSIGFPEVGREFCRWYNAHDWRASDGSPILDWRACAEAWVLRKQRYLRNCIAVAESVKRSTKRCSGKGGVR